MQPHCTVIVGKTNSGKMKWILDLLETKYKHKFEVIHVVIICPMLFKNKTYLNRRWIYSDDNVYLCDLDRERMTLNEVIDLFQNILDGIQTLFIVNDCSSTQEIKYHKKNMRCKQNGVQWATL